MGLLHPTDAATARGRGLLCGLAVGLFESGLIVAAPTHSFDHWFDWAVIPVAAPVLYAIGGWLLGALPPARRMPWWLLGAIGAAWLVRARGASVLAPRLPLAIAGGAAALLLLIAATRIGAATARRIERIALGVLVAMGLGSPLLLRSLGPKAPIDRALARTAPPADAQDLVLVTWDTVRADTLPCFGGGGLEMPALERLVREGALFTTFRAVAPSTAPAHATMLSGVYPIRHGLRSNGDVAPSLPFPRLSELLAQSGWATGAFVSTYVLRHDYGFDRGFDRFDDRTTATALELLAGRIDLGSMVARKLLPALRDQGVNTPGEVTLERAMAWVGAQERPFFLWTHFYDAHAPYTPDAENKAKALARASEGPHAVDAAFESELVLQRGEILELDELLARLIAGLEQRDPGLRRTWIVLLADHGECFGEGGLRAHHRSLFDATQHVALVVRPPSGSELPVGVRVDVPSCQVDLLPTLCELLRRPRPADLDGESLVPAWRGGDGDAELSERGFYLEAFQQELGAERLQGWCESGWRYVRSLAGREWLLPPGEVGARDVLEQQPARAAAMRRRLDDFLATHAPAQSGAHERSEEERRALDALGYGAGR
jgi:arylsulfatase A-like enzyme